MDDKTKELREKIVFKLIEKQNYFLDAPFNIIVASSILCNYIENGKVPRRNSWLNGNEVADEIMYELAEEILNKRKQTIQTANNENDSNGSFIKKIFKFF